MAGLMALLCAPAWSQDIEETEEQFDPARLAEGMKSFTKDVRIEEADLVSFMKLYTSFDGLYGEDFARKFTKEGKFDLNLVVKDKAYADWASAKGLDGKKWLQRSTRIMGLQLKRHFTMMAAEAEKETAAELKDLESMRKEMGEEAYTAAKEAMTAAMKQVRSLADAFKDFPAPNEAETKLLEKHQKALDRAMDMDDGGDDDGCGCEDDDGCGCDCGCGCGCEDDDGCGCDDGCGN